MARCTDCAACARRMSASPWEAGSTPEASSTTPRSSPTKSDWTLCQTQAGIRHSAQGRACAKQVHVRQAACRFGPLHTFVPRCGSLSLTDCWRRADANANAGGRVAMMAAAAEPRTAQCHFRSGRTIFLILDQHLLAHETMHMMGRAAMTTTSGPLDPLYMWLSIHGTGTTVVWGPSPISVAAASSFVEDTSSECDMGTHTRCPLSCDVNTGMCTCG